MSFGLLSGNARFISQTTTFGNDRTRPYIAIGGDVTEVGEYRIHSFSLVGNATLVVTQTGGGSKSEIYIAASGAGGGGGGDDSGNPGAAGASGAVVVASVDRLATGVYGVAVAGGGGGAQGSVNNTGGGSGGINGGGRGGNAGSPGSSGGGGGGGGYSGVFRSNTFDAANVVVIAGGGGGGGGTNEGPANETPGKGGNVYSATNGVSLLGAAGSNYSGDGGGYGGAGGGRYGGAAGTSGGQGGGNFWGNNTVRVSLNGNQNSGTTRGAAVSNTYISGVTIVSGQGGTAGAPTGGAGGKGNVIIFYKF